MTSKQTEDMHLKVPQISIQGNPTFRSDSVTSLNSVGSCRSVYSNATVQDMVYCEDQRQAIIDKRKKEADYLDLMEAELPATFDGFQGQKNIISIVKDRVKKIQDLIAQAKTLHAEADKEEEKYKRTVEGTE